MRDSALFIIPLRGGRVNSCAQNLRFRYIFGRAVRYNKSSTGFGSEPDILQMDCMEAKEYAQRRIWRRGCCGCFLPVLMAAGAAIAALIALLV